MSFSPMLLTSKLFKFTALTLALILAGCGSDGVDSVAPPFDGGNNGGQSGGGGTVTPVSEVNITPISLLDTNGNVTRTITSTGASAQVRVTDGAGAPISSSLVTFSGDGVNFGTSNGAVLTNEAGEASISVKPTDSTDTGSYQLSAIGNN